MRIKQSQENYNIVKCHSCGIDLCGSPKIDVEGIIYCYKCAKNAVDILNKKKYKIAHNQYLVEKSEFDKKKEIYLNKHSRWVRDCNLYVDKNRLGFWPLIILLFIIGYLAETIERGAGFITFIIASITAYKISDYITNKKLKEFNNKYPEPKFNMIEPVFNGYERTSHKIEIENKLSQNLEFNYRKSILERDKYTCQNCGKIFDKKYLEVHHIKPRADEGPDDPTNLITLCFHCHDREEWYGHKRKNPTTLVELRILKKSKIYHRETCSIIKNSDPENIIKIFSLNDVKENNFQPCKKCRPDLSFSREQLEN
jgi:hypothetical protein